MPVVLTAEVVPSATDFDGAIETEMCVCGGEKLDGMVEHAEAGTLAGSVSGPSHVRTRRPAE